MFQAPVFSARSLTVFVTIPLSQRKRSSPSTATRRIQPRSCAAAPLASAVVSSAIASNPCGVSTPRYSASRCGLVADVNNVASGVVGAETAIFASVIGECFRGLAPHFLRKLGARLHPDYSLGIRCGRPAPRSRRSQGVRMIEQQGFLYLTRRMLTIAAGFCLWFATVFAPAQQPSSPTPPP